MHDKVTNEANDALFHLLLMLHLNLVGEDLHADSGETRDDLADSKITVVPKRFHSVVTPTFTSSIRGSRY